MVVVLVVCDVQVWKLGLGWRFLMITIEIVIGGILGILTALFIARYIHSKEQQEWDEETEQRRFEEAAKRWHEKKVQDDEKPPFVFEELEKR